MVERWKRDGGTVKKVWSTSGTMMVEQWNSYGGRLEQIWWNSGTVEQ